MCFLSLNRNTICVWQFAAECSDEEYSMLWALLSRDEQERAQRFHFDADRKRSVVARGNLRRLLAEQLSCTSEEIAFRVTANGKPELHLPRAGALGFNVSHSGELVLIAVAQRPVGVDVEQSRRDMGVREIAQRFFCAAEWEELSRLEAATQDEAFFRCWTRKEAIVKAVGEGLRVPLNSFYVGTDAARERIVETGDGRRWKVCSWTPRPGYAAGLAAPAGDWQLKSA